MTAEVAILNSQGAAIAADSAVTIGLESGENKIYYTAEKIFSISKNLPIGVMIYHSAEYMGVNWKLIINEYSCRLSEKDKFKKLEDISKNFIKFLTDFEYENMENKQQEYLTRISARASKVIDEYVKQICEDKYSETQYSSEGLSNDEAAELLSSALEKRADELKNKKIHFPDFSGKYILSNTELIKTVAEHVIEIPLDDKQLGEFVNILMQEVKAYGLTNYSGVVFVGFGEEEIFPSVCSIDIYGKLGAELIYKVDDPDHIESDKHSMIYPFAQVDVINTFIRGIDPNLQFNILPELLDKFLEKTGLVEEEEKRIELASSFITILKEQVINVKYRDPILDIVASLPVINLAEMAEALINITSLRRHNSSDQDTVGGPTDVAIISKVDGFIWVKRKNNLSY